ncbi:MAG: hypothetical protein EBX68_03245, partial [Betaproteobacteria bacterium]|nr:hypothetical protein [Betaproteobacteria bacterium]
MHQPLPELLERVRQRLGRRAALHQVALKAPGPFLVHGAGLLGEFAVLALSVQRFGLVGAQPLQNRGSVGLQVRRRVRMLAVTDQVLKPRMRHLVHEGRGIRALEQADQPLAVAPDAA